jgi:hypothetical protein
MHKHEDLEERLTEFENWGIDDALEKIASNDDLYFNLGDRWSISQEGTDGSLVIRDN